MFGSSTSQETTNVISHQHYQTINPNFYAFHDPLINMNQDHVHNNNYNKYQDYDTSFLDLLVDGDQEYYSNYTNNNASIYLENPFKQQEISSSTYSTSGNSSSASSFDATPTHVHMNNESSSTAIEKEKKGEKHAIAFRTKTQLETLDDGYKWRKYGKKKVKTNINLRNYYKCSSGDCKVKKKVERDGSDSRYLMTTYEGKHNHESPFIIYWNEKNQANNFLNESSSSY
ncbi:probable WRKY transcription factor 51 [Solanum pennellii]|uniref:Probable WRKY transcription factor 51 n=1 Tax=Solanum pennellii TaxID=28526 RepID=A0ABM1GLQ1_SOLPN|nr:probable WRKY transcription factor 51 [Solanum pennellii]